MTQLSKAGRDALEALHTGEPVQGIDTSTATALIEAGFAREANVQHPGDAPKGKTFVNITTKGRGALAKAGTLDKAPAEGQSAPG